MKRQVGDAGQSACAKRAHSSDAVQSTFEEQSRCRPRLSRSIFAVAVRPRLIAERMRSIGIGSNIDAFLVLRSRHSQTFDVLRGYPGVIPCMVIEHGTKYVLESVGLNHPAIVRDGRSQALTMAGELQGQGSAHSESHYAMNVSFDEFPRIHELAARIDVLESQRLIELAHQGLGNLSIACDHTADPAIEVGNDDAVPLTCQAGTQILNLRVQSPPFVQEHDAGIRSLLLRPKLDAIDLNSLDRTSPDVGIH